MSDPANEPGAPPTSGYSVIANCPMEFECPKQWETMDETSSPDVRHCDSCNKDVHFCATEEKLERMAAAGECVSFFTVREQRVRRLSGSLRRDDFDEPTNPAVLRAFIDGI
ncbi:hypothetical protein [Hydrogenophaga sp.]|uniref:hypothetical protein n=1 Tax=Hydrogenophaga sp. TaxID=1904254 RepID=UPI002724C0A5|nr:hypothetical protein [Hydrogenophaga sp.]MDO8906837.1 hypothetical protein [Hydrogenophaga sp.]